MFSMENPFKQSKKSVNKAGAWAEQEAALYLQQQGLKFHSCNYRCRGGEIDLIMHDDDVLVFVEVRARKYNHFGSAIETVDQRKQRKLIFAARHFLHKHRLTEHVVCRFDVVGIESTNTTSSNSAKVTCRTTCRTTCKVTWIRHAFDAH